MRRGHRSRHGRSTRPTRARERGAAAVEFALVALPLITLLFGIMEFGWIFNQQVSLSNAARESARYYAIGHKDGVTVGTAVAQGQAAAPTIDWSQAGATITITNTCSAKFGRVDATASIPMPSLTGLFAPLLGPTLTGRSSTICGG